MRYTTQAKLNKMNENYWKLLKTLSNSFIGFAAVKIKHEKNIYLTAFCFDNN